MCKKMERVYCVESLCFIYNSLFNRSVEMGGLETLEKLLSHHSFFSDWRLTISIYVP